MIIGGGPAGSVLARLLASKNYKVVVINEEYYHRLMTVGETLSPASRPILHRLKIEDTFEKNHLKSYGNRSSWGSPVLNDIDFIFSRYGHGWHLDRAQFNQDLQLEAIKAGAVFLNNARPDSLDEQDGCWVIKVKKQEPVTCRARYIVDASGRSRWLLRKLNIPITEYDELIAFAGLFSTSEKKDKDSRTLIEAVSEGWWYSALLPSLDRVIIFFTDISTGLSRKMTCQSEFLSLMKKTLFIQEYLDKYSYELTIPPAGRPANSSRAEQIVGRNWLALGDAAISFDPLSSQGIITAIEAAEVAAEAIEKALSGDQSQLSEYINFVSSKYEKYLEEYKRYYSEEKRWIGRPFWKTRLKSLA